MNIDLLKNIVKSGVNSDRNFSLSTALLSSASIDRVASDFLPNNTVLLAEANIEEPADGQSIIVRGKGVDLPFTGMDAELLFYLHVDNGAAEAALKLTAKGADGWNLATGFPPFKDSLASVMPFSTSPPPALSLHSHADGDGNVPGMLFTGDANLGAMAFGLAGFLGLQSLHLSGSVILKENGSKLHAVDLHAPPGHGIGLGIATITELSFKVGNRLDYNPIRQNYYATPYIELGAKIPVTAQGAQHELPVTVQIFDLHSDIRFTADLTGGIDAALDEIKSLMNHVSFGGISPGGNFQLEDVLKLSNFFFDFNLDDRKVTQINMGLQSATHWTVLHSEATNKNLVVQNVSLTLMLFDPFGTQDKSVSIKGEIALGDAGILAIYTRFPDWVIQGCLKEGTTLNLSELVGELVGSAISVPAMDLYALDFELSSGSYSLAAEVEGSWDIGDSLIGITNVGFALTYTAGAVATAQLTGVLNIAGVYLHLSADYLGAEAGWEFSGSTGPGQKINIGTLFADLAGIFGAVTLPSSISDLVIENLAVSFNDKTRDFNFTCEAQLPVEDKEVGIVLNIAITKVETAYTYLLSCQIKIGELAFNLTFDSDATSNLFFAIYNHSGDQQSIRIKSLIDQVSSRIAGIIPESLEIDLKDVLFAFSKDATGTKFLCGLDIGTGISLSNLPLVGQEFSTDRTVSVDDLQLLIVSRGFTQHEVAIINNLAPAGVTKMPVKTGEDNANPNDGNSAPSPNAPPAVVIPEGVTVSATMHFGGSTQVLSMPVVTGKQEPASSAPPTPGPAVTPPASTTGLTPAAASSVNTKWLNLQKSFGPVYLDKVGVQYQDATLWFLLNAALSAAGLTISLNGLSVGSPLNRFNPQFNLHGLGIAFESGGGAVEVGGAFLRTQKEGQPDEYDGTAVIKTEEATLSALGSYTKLDGHPSLFIYTFLDYPLGGPAFFFVTGLAAGFGYNRKLIVPSIENVADFPLVQQAVGGQSAPGGLSGTLQALQQYIPPGIGEVFLAVGVKFNSFKLIDSFALLTVDFSSRFVVNILGLSTAIVPTPEAGKSVTPLAEVQIAWKAAFDPAAGFLGVDARLTPNSYILSRDCRLTGGYAFYSWFSGEHAGDFVQTLGGYHPRFVVPAHYPVVPRLAFNWQVSGVLTIKGDAYYALTGSALMAGGHLEVLFDEGDLKAWIKLGADFLISWKPYHYDASVYVDVGVSYTFDIDLLFTSITITISVDVGADLHLWGPDFSGTADVHLWIISFTISFGAGASQTPNPIDWTTFRIMYPENWTGD